MSNYYGKMKLFVSVFQVCSQRVGETQVISVLLSFHSAVEL